MNESNKTESNRTDWLDLIDDSLFDNQINSTIGDDFFAPIDDKNNSTNMTDDDWIFADLGNDTVKNDTELKGQNQTLEDDSHLPYCE